MKKNIESEYTEFRVIRCGPAMGEQIGDHPGDKRIRNRQIRRAWSNGRRILAHNKYKGYD